LSKKDRARQGVVVEVVVVGKEKLGQGRNRDWQEILQREPCKLLYDEKVTPDIRPYAACSYAHFLRSGSKPEEVHLHPFLCFVIGEVHLLYLCGFTEKSISTHSLVC